MGDTANDLRLLIIERLITRLKERCGQRQYGSQKQTAAARTLLDELSGKLAALRYSYMDDPELLAYDDTRAIARGAQRIAELLQEHAAGEDRLAFARFFGRCAGGLVEALKRDATLEGITPVAVGEVLSADKLPKTKSLLRCRVKAFGQTLQIVTNLTDTRRGDLMKVASVPPAEVMGLLSEAQFVGRAGAGSTVGERPELTAGEAREIRRAMGELLD